MGGFTNPLTPVTNAVEHNPLARMLANKVGDIIHSTPAQRGATMATLGAWDFEHPGASQAYWKNIIKSLNPTTPKGLIALMATVVGPRMGDPEIGPVNPETGITVPLVRVSNPNQSITSDVLRNLRVDFAGPLGKKALLTREAASVPIRAHINQIKGTDPNADLVHHYAHTLTETLHQGHEPKVDLAVPTQPGPGPQPRAPLTRGRLAVGPSRGITPQQATLLQQMLGRRLA